MKEHDVDMEALQTQLRLIRKPIYSDIFERIEDEIWGWDLDNTPTPEQTAVHEAAHYIAGHTFMPQISGGAVLNLDENLAGFEMYFDPEAAFTPEDFQRFAVICLIGPMAQMALTTGRLPRRPSRLDLVRYDGMKDVADVADAATRSGVTRAWWNQSTLLAFEFLCDHWGEIEIAAEDLLRLGYLPDADVDCYLRQDEAA